MIWRTTTCHPCYSVSNTGLVRRSGGQECLKPWSHKSGHLYVSLGRNLRRQVHHLVLEAFVGPKPTDKECRHLDGDPKNNRCSNLTWGTRSQNIEDYRRLNGRHHRASTTLLVAQKIRDRFSGRRGQQTKLAKEFGLSVSVVNRIINGRVYL